MTNDQLNQLFESAKTISTETSSEEIASWVGVAAASSTGVLGTIGKLKLFIAKKSFIMLASTLTVITAGIITTVALLPSDSKQERKSNIEQPKVEFKVPNSAPQKVVKKEASFPLAQPKVERPLEVSERLEIFKMALLDDKSPEASLQVIAHPADLKERKDTNTVKVSKDFKVSDFTKLEASGIYDLVLIQGDSPGVKIKASDEVLKKMEVKNDGQSLKIDMVGKMKKNDKTIVYVTFTNLEDFTYSGVGDVYTEGKINLQKLKCDLTGIGDVSLDMTCNDLKVDFSGVGDLHISGSGDQAKYDWAGVGDLQAKNMRTKFVDVTLSGVGDVSVNAFENIEIELTGIGDVKYTGSPKNKNINKTGMGKISGS